MNGYQLANLRKSGQCCEDGFSIFAEMRIYAACSCGMVWRVKRQAARYTCKCGAEFVFRQVRPAKFDLLKYGPERSATTALPVSRETLITANAE